MYELVIPVEHSAVAGDVNTVLDVAWSHLNSMNGTLAQKCVSP